MSDVTGAFVEHGLGARFEDLPAPAVVAVKTFLLDTLGVGIAGAAAPVTQPVRAAAARWASEGAARVWGQASFATSPANAAFVNGFQIHCQEFDCVHEPAVVHPLATILAALMAEVEAGRRPVSGPELAMAIAVAVDMAAGLGVAARSAIRFFRPANAGIFGATLGIARLRGFDPATARDALGHALAFCSGTMQAHVEGKPALPAQIGNAARGAICACDLAEAGLAGAQDSLEGPFGYFALFEEETAPEAAVEGLGQAWRIAEVSHKPFPTGRAAQGGIVLMQTLRDRGVRADEVETVTLRAPPLIRRLVGRPIGREMTANYARLCFQYSGAVALIRGGVGLADFTAGALNDPEVLALGARIKLVEDGSDDPAAFVPQTAAARLKDGRMVEAGIEALYGSPAKPMRREDQIAKFRACCAFGFGCPRPDIEDALIARADGLERLEDVAGLARLAAGEEP